ncbi:hypothetical protein DC31_05490 [Microbacterium sp. CH12i]|nr:hypothetical protein DC31_05490 [Microbacterium sp. CH12i]
MCQTVDLRHSLGVPTAKRIAQCYQQQEERSQSLLSVDEGDFGLASSEDRSDEVRLVLVSIRDNTDVIQQRAAGIRAPAVGALEHRDTDLGRASEPIEGAPALGGDVRIRQGVLL